MRRIDAKTPIGSTLRSRDWEDVPLELRERAQFSAGVTSARLLQAIQDRLSGEVNQRREVLDRTGQENVEATFDRSSFIDAIREIARAEGLTPETGRGTITDITSIPRLGMIYDMQNQMASGYARWKMDQNEGALLLYPAWRLVREREAKVPRNWRARWNEAGDAVGWDGASQSTMVALKTSPIWAKLSRFGTPWPPFDFNSGMGVEDVDRDEAIALGLLKEDEIPEATGVEDFNQELEASTSGLSDSLVEKLKEAFGSQVEIDGDSARWVGGEEPRRPRRRQAKPELSEEPAPRNEPEAWIREKNREVLAAKVAEVGIQGFGKPTPLEEHSFGRPLADAKAVGLVNDVAAVFHDLRKRFPNLRKDAVQKLLLVTPSGNGVLGKATLRMGAIPARLSVRTRDYHEKNAERWQKAEEARKKEGRIRFTVDQTFDGTVRHELGHTLTTKDHLDALAKTPYGPSWARKNLSDYSGHNDRETLAEAFCEFTKPDYKRGSLPELLERILDDMIAGV